MTEMTSIYPWQEAQWQRFNAIRKSDHLPHALLLLGSNGIGKTHFAHILANSLLCENTNNDGYACGQCNSCKVQNSGAHPDYKFVGLPDGKQQIPISAIRQLTDFLTLSRSYGGYRVVEISSADKMNINAANSLLKSLEEPPGDTVIILVADQLSRLPVTLRSRCQLLVMDKPDKASSLAWLEQQEDLQSSAEMLLSVADNKPLLALAMDTKEGLLEERNKFAKDLITILQQSKSVTDVAKDWQKADLNTLLNWQLKWLHALLKLFAAPDETNNLSGNRFLSQIESAVESPQQLWKLYEDLLNLKSMTEYPLNRQMFVESMLLLWRDVGRPQ